MDKADSLPCLRSTNSAILLKWLTKWQFACLCSVNPNIRADPEKQVETGRVGLENPATGKHSLGWRLAQVRRHGVLSVVGEGFRVAYALQRWELFCMLGISASWEAAPVVYI